MSPVESARVRPAAPSDAAALARMEADSEAAGLGPLLAPSATGRLTGRTTDADRAQVWETWPLEHPDDVLLVSGRDQASDGPVGVVLARCEPWHGMDARVHALHVLPEHRRQGHGRALLHAAVTELWARGCSSLGLATLDDDPVRAWYDLIGGVPVADQVDVVAGRDLRRVVYRWEDASELARRLAA
jgi:GNAT superfamily N-acetyltransferase